ncbi:hypothetical protein ARMSODRAFT_956209 [Armillaria solidipes]|uniref:Uncharacterized protein n=1 Tax=Armillaria solidipes TaxID=1076256 RepID=A0A2H3BH19_9AGAR|nr:hypothetical protein ARMSODRAFT_956209 [Armillaria solidipes]
MSPSATFAGSEPHCMAWAATSNRPPVNLYRLTASSVRNCVFMVLYVHTAFFGTRNFDDAICINCINPPFIDFSVITHFSPPILYPHRAGSHYYNVHSLQPPDQSPRNNSSWIYEHLRNFSVGQLATSKLTLNCHEQRVFALATPQFDIQTNTTVASSTSPDQRLTYHEIRPTLYEMIRNIPSRCTNPTPYIQPLTAPRSLVLHPIPRLSVFTHQSTHKLRTPNPSRFTNIAFAHPPDCRRFPPKCNLPLTLPLTSASQQRRRSPAWVARS